MIINRVRDEASFRKQVKSALHEETIRNKPETRINIKSYKITIMENVPGYSKSNNFYHSLREFMTARAPKRNKTESIQERNSTIPVSSQSKRVADSSANKTTDDILPTNADQKADVDRTDQCISPKASSHISSHIRSPSWKCTRIFEKQRLLPLSS